MSEVMIARWDEQTGKRITERFIDSEVIKATLDKLAESIKEAFENPITEEEITQIKTLWNEMAVDAAEFYRQLNDFIEKAAATQ